jgi:hypothetical protein
MALMDKHDGAMPIPFRHFRDDLRETLSGWEKITTDLLDVTYPQENAMKREREKLPNERFDPPHQAFVWWRHCFGGVRGSWNDLHLLAGVWRLTECKDVQEFRRVVVRQTKGGVEFEAPPDWCWKLCHYAR